MSRCIYGAAFPPFPSLLFAFIQMQRERERKRDCNKNKLNWMLFCNVEMFS